MKPTNLAAGNRLIERWVFLIHTRRHDSTDSVRVEAEKERHGEARCVLDAENPMHCRFEHVVRQTLEEVTNVYHVRAGNRRGIEPFVLCRENLEAATHVLPKEGKTLDVGVGADAYLQWIGFRFLHWVVYVHAIGSWAGGYSVEIVFWKVEGQSEDTDK